MRPGGSNGIENSSVDGSSRPAPLTTQPRSAASRLASSSLYSEPKHGGVCGDVDVPPIPSGIMATFRLGYSRSRSRRFLIKMVNLYFEAATLSGWTTPWPAFSLRPAARSLGRPMWPWISSSVSLVTFKITF